MSARFRADAPYRRSTARLAVLALVVVLTACGTPAAITPAPPSVAQTAASLPAPRSPLDDFPRAAQNTQFPPIVAPPDNPSTLQKVELGRQLFFDPVLSASNAMSCATCHHPDLGLSNGAAISAPRAGAPGRNVPSLWNAAYNRHLLWDGRVESLEAQAVDPLTLPNEMAETPEEIEAELRAIPAYVALFDVAFGGGEQAVTFDNVTRALAAFQRTLLSSNSPFDRYVAGDASALTAQEQRGLALFFSPETHCAECHQPPTFAHETFRVVGVPSEDPGRAGVSATGVRGAFKVPTLRNVALTAPYMHNGSLATLAEVVQFYADGAGRPAGFPFVDPLLKGFELSAQDKADLVAFLRALTDESALPAVPDQALSGLPSAQRSD
ncbi:MAG TPA: cytochrome c peroxidase [Anaerolineae bacterium]|nr:cytochrome c peroxidase [Anaerolineae bacterium]